MNKLAIIADIHDNLTNLKRFLNWANKEKISEIICCGDVTNSETLNLLATKFKNPIHLVKGNMEIYIEEEIPHYPNITYYKKVAKFSYKNYNIGVCHEPFLIDKLKVYKDLDYIFYAHTHEPWLYKYNKTIISNPGTLGGVFSQATFSTLDCENNNLELKKLDLI